MRHGITHDRRTHLLRRLAMGTALLLALVALVRTARDAIAAPARTGVTSAPAASATPPPATIEGPATLPSLDGAQLWINSAPLTAGALKGKVVVVDFWTFLCGNCQAALPYVRRLDADFRAKGLVVVGVHTPELAPERDVANVRKAVTRLGVNYPVALDPDFTIWNRFNNRYWPSIYVFDKQGTLRYHWDGEGDYEAQRALVAKLLAE